MIEEKTDSQPGVDEQSNELCPVCNRKLLENGKGTKWCTVCRWSNDAVLSNLLKEIKRPVNGLY